MGSMDEKCSITVNLEEDIKRKKEKSEVTKELETSVFPTWDLNQENQIESEIKANQPLDKSQPPREQPNNSLLTKFTLANKPKVKKSEPHPTDYPDANYLPNKNWKKTSSNRKAVPRPPIAKASPLPQEPRNSTTMETKTQILSVPWRKGMDWGPKTHQDLKTEILTHKLCEDADIEEINVLLVGEISAGKSSFFNSVESVFKKRVATRANSGFAGESVTTQYRQYRVKAKDEKNHSIKFKFCDSMGLEADDVGMSAADIGKIMDGHVKERAELSKGIRPNMQGYNRNPTEDDKIHCVAFVVNALTVSMMEEGITKKIKDIRREANGRDMVPIVILTRIDEMCKVTQKDTSKVFLSREVEAKVDDVSKLFGINQSQIYPVRNYNKQTECEQDIDILILRVVRQIVRNSEDILEDKSAIRELEDKEDNKERKGRKKKEGNRKKKAAHSSDEDSGSEEGDATTSEGDEETFGKQEKMKKKGEKKKGADKKARRKQEVTKKKKSVNTSDEDSESEEEEISAKQEKNTKKPARRSITAYPDADYL